MALHDGHGPLRCHPGCPAHAEFMAEMHDQMRPEPVRHETPAPDDWPVEALLRGRAEVERYAHEHGLLTSDQIIVVEVRAIRRRERIPGQRPQSAIVVHHGEDGWT